VEAARQPPAAPSNDLGWKSASETCPLTRTPRSRPRSAAELKITPGTSKWNWIEHRLFNHISANWRGLPLESYEAVVELIANTTTRSGLRVQAGRDAHLYPTGIEVSDDELAEVDVFRHEFHGDWNYTIKGLRSMEETE
jgi:hypothetical protein